MSEAKLQSEIQMLVTKNGGRVFRNNVGKAWVGRPNVIKRKQQVIVGAGDVVLYNARPFHAGLCKGSSDLIGWTPILITEKYLGKTLAIFSGLEIKGPRGRASKEQINFTNTVIEAGGIAAICKSTEDYLEVISGF